MRTTARQLRTSKPSIEEMRYDLAEEEAMNMNVSNIIDLIMYGCVGIDEAPDIEVRDEWEQNFGETNNE